MTRSAPLSVLLVDDEAPILDCFSALLESGGIEPVICCQDPRSVPELLEKNRVGAVLLDLWMPHLPGDELLTRIVEEHPGLPIIVVTGMNDLDNAVSCMRKGAFDYMVKPVEETRLISGVRRALERTALNLEYAGLRETISNPELQHPEAFAGIITRNTRMLGLFRYLETVAPSSHPVLIQGETGVGKELFARAVHQVSDRNGPFVSVNVAGLDDTVFSDTLFGHVRGAYTGADGRRGGMIEQAGKGTLFLDEIGDLSPMSQVKLLRVLQEREYFPLGSDIAKPVQARIVVATNQDLERKRNDGSFRKDLYYRLSTHQIVIPPLRERRDDVGMLSRHFGSQVAGEMKREEPCFDGRLLRVLESMEFPGNVRELQALVTDLVRRSTSSRVTLDELHQRCPDHPLPPDGSGETLILPEDGSFPTMDEMEEWLIREAMIRSAGNQTTAARLLGISRPTLCKRLKKIAPAG